MKCKNKLVKIKGYRQKFLGKAETLVPMQLECLITNDEKGKSLSISDGMTSFHFPFEQIERYLK